MLCRNLTRRSSTLRAYGPARDLGFASAPYLKRYIHIDPERK